MRSHAVALFIGAAMLTPAHAEVDLVGHKGFEACWSRALTTIEFADAVNTANEGFAGCIAASPGGTTPYCTTSTCSGNVPGCPLTLRASSVAHDFDGSGYVRYNATVGMDALAMDVTVSGAHCVVTINDASNLSATAALFFGVSDDGNSGQYVGGPVSVENAQTTGLRSTDYVVSGDFLCYAAGTFVPASLILSILSTGVDSSLQDAQQATLGESICE
jgi:hypothetical protein